RTHIVRRTVMTLTDEKKQRRHDERFQAEVVDALSRIHQVLHDISDGIDTLNRNSRDDTVTSVAAPPYEGPTLLTVSGLAEQLGVSRASVYGLRAAGNAPPTTKIGRRILFHRDDVADWLTRLRDNADRAPEPWKRAFLPGRVGATFPRTS